MTYWESKAFDYTDRSKSSLYDAAYNYASKIHGHYMVTLYDPRDAFKRIAAIVVYLIRLDNFSESEEKALWERVFGSETSYYDGVSMYYDCGGESTVTSWISSLPSVHRDNFLELACCVFAADGSIYDEEKAVLRRFG